MTKQARLNGSDARVHLRAIQIERRERVQSLRREDQAREAKEREAVALLKLRQAEAEIAKAKGKEIAAAAKKAVEEARLRAKEEKRLAELAKERTDRLRLGFAAALCARLNAYLREGPVGQERRGRAERQAKHGARRRTGLQCLPVPRFWLGATSGLLTVSASSGLRLRGKQEVLWASPDFAWQLFGRKQAKHDCARHAFRKLVERLMPEYFTLFGARYGVEGLLAEARNILDLAFVAANWRYTAVVSPKLYRGGVHEWPPGDGWGSPAWTECLHAAWEGCSEAPAAGHAAGIECLEKSGALSQATASVAPGECPAKPPALGQAAAALSASAASAGSADQPQTTSRGSSESAAVVEWVMGRDGHPVRTEDGMRLWLATLGLHVQPSSTHGVNNCLIDSVLCALQHSRHLRPELSLEDRRNICAFIRHILVVEHGQAENSYLAHDVALPWIFKVLREQYAHLFVDDTHAAPAGLEPRSDDVHPPACHGIALTVTVVDRFTCRDELLPSEPVLVPALTVEAREHVQIQLYACTHLDGNGYHYEWIAAGPVDCT